MSNSILILGQSGTGKSTSLRNLNPDETFIINVVGKSLPFRGGKAKYKKLSSDGMAGNYYASDDSATIKRIIKLINIKRPDIKNIILDDFGYTIANSFMRKAGLRGYDKFVEIAKDTFDILESIGDLRDDLYCVVIMHTEIDAHGVYKPKSVGKMIDQYICIEGKFTHVLHSLVIEGQYRMLTNFDGQHMAKNPMGCFEAQLVDNDLNEILKQIESYNSGE